MELPSKILKQTAFNTIPEIEEHLLIVMKKVLTMSYYLNHCKLI